MSGEARGFVFDIKRFSVHDGPGIRTTVFVKGCPLRCPWCHNPEGISLKPEIFFSPERCVGCGACAQVCLQEAHSWANGRHVFHRPLCEGCGRCVASCPTGAIELAGVEMSVEEVLNIVERDKPFYQESGGGLTVSGGEPLLQFEFTKALLEAAKEREIHTCLDTSGAAPWRRLEELIGVVDLFLFDVKVLDEKKHRELVGISLEPLLKNLRRLDQARSRLILRCPIIPGVNDVEEHLYKLARLARSLKNVEAVEILPFHKLAVEKYKRLGREYSFAKVEPPLEEQVKGWIATLRDQGVKEVRLG